MSIDGSHITVSGQGGSATVDPETLALSNITSQADEITFEPSVTPPADSVFAGVLTQWDVKDVRVDGLWITISFPGSAGSPESQCTVDYTVEVVEDDQAVTATIKMWTPLRDHRLQFPGVALPWAGRATSIPTRRTTWKPYASKGHVALRPVLTETAGRSVPRRRSPEERVPLVSLVRFLSAARRLVT
ncbi:MAG: hypothetical protein H6512_00160 [Acidimicrobiia bacterium]|nr:hypothetical protein [Acidimicrobiia bacterium]